jgi:hypothetical protein
MSCILGYYLWYCLFICLQCLFLITFIRRRRLREASRAQRSRLWAAASGRARQVTLDHIDHMCSLSFSSIYIGMHALILLPKPNSLGILVHTWLVMLNHAVMSVVQVFHTLWCWVWLVSLWEMVSHPSRCELAVVRIDVVVWSMVGMVEMVNTVMTCGAQIC